MCLAPYPPGGMVVAIAVNFITFYCIIAVELNYLQGYFNDLIESLKPHPRPTPSEEVTCI
jgi:hypothetical protein